ncbi:MAG: AAA family ATPase [Trueperaceae bacterium]|nr:AAA family ATPase [Trueperaceae bacterium]
MDQTNFSLSFNDIVKLIINGALLALTAAMVVGAATYILSKTLTPKYEARATVLAANSSSDARSFGVVTPSVPALDVSAYRKAVLSSPVLVAAMNSLGIAEQNTASIDAFKTSITIHTEAANDSSLIDIITTETSAELAQAKANALAHALVNWDRARASENLQRIVQSLEQQVAVLDSQIANLQTQGASQDQIDGRISLRAQQQDQLAYARALSTSANGLLSIIEPALVPISPVSPRPLLNALIAAFVSALLTYALLHLRNSLMSKQEKPMLVSGQSALSILAKFPPLKADELKISNDHIQFLRTNLLFSNSKAHPKTILITSPHEVRGKTNVALSLAEDFARNQSHTLLVDADLRNPGIAELYGMPAAHLNHASLSNWLRAPEESQDVVKVGVGDKALHVIPSFKEAGLSSELLNTFEQALAKWQSEYEVIVIDAPPVLNVADSLAMAPFCSDTVLVVDEELSDQQDLQSAEHSLKRLKANVTGYVIANSKPSPTKTSQSFTVNPKTTQFGHRS